MSKLSSKADPLLSPPLNRTVEPVFASNWIKFSESVQHTIMAKGFVILCLVAAVLGLAKAVVFTDCGELGLGWLASGGIDPLNCALTDVDSI